MEVVYNRGTKSLKKQRAKKRPVLMFLCMEPLLFDMGYESQITFIGMTNTEEDREKWAREFLELTYPDYKFSNIHVIQEPKGLFSAKSSIIDKASKATVLCMHNRFKGNKALTCWIEAVELA